MTITTTQSRAAYRLLFLLAFPALMLAGCGGDRSGSETANLSTEEAAEQADGVITATVDGKQRTWYITSDTRDGQYVSQSDWSPSFGDGAHVNLFGHTSPATLFQSREAMMLEINLAGRGETPPVTSASITFLSGGMMNNHASGHRDGSASVKVDQAVFTDDSLEISGTFSGVLPFRSRSTVESGVSTETITIDDGAFEATVRRLEGG